MKVTEDMVAVKCKRRVFVTGIGVVSPLGPDAAETERALLAGRDAVSEVTLFDVSKTRCKTAGQVEDAWLSGAVPHSRKANRLHRSARMVTVALREALGMAGAARPERLVIATSSGGMSNGEAYYREALRSASRRRFAEYVANYTPQKPVLDAMEPMGLRMPVQILTNASSSGANAVGHAFELVRGGLCGCVLCGGYDPLAELVFVGFDSLQASTPEKIWPFDRGRTGLVLGEGAVWQQRDRAFEWAQRNALIIQVAALAVYFMTDEERAEIQRRAHGNFDLVDIPRCAAEQYPRLVLGQNDVSVFSRTLPWDHAAGTLMGARYCEGSIAC